MGYQVEIDKKSGFCSGVIRAIRCTETALGENKPVYSLGAIVHNNEELHRLEAKGLRVINRGDLEHIPEGSTILIRAHGEPPSTYALMAERKIRLLECTCPVVLLLQKKIKKEHARIKPQNGQIIIFGKQGHAEVDGLVGQVGGDALVVENEKDLEGLAFSGGPVSLFSQTTQNPEGYQKIREYLAKLLEEKGIDPGMLKVFDTICSQVDGRQAALSRFALSRSVILFVAGKESSNGKVLFRTCKEANPRSHVIENPGEISPEWFRPGDTVGICGATSTPFWLMEQVAEKVRNL
ncbi:MAG TPA: 4-hydroxy-3-methylbut-2-enyl diphosphate reductase [Bacteroidales bacterium]|jgi:4-hydroxy-3-methylbut-2-enyl diphosphate reductase|nr:4-hydroxy-3-methylbut-2-enyl diphosphate reductase [Bacteroidales bacterium]MCZ2417234.1 4-hydroxy-3-methylbut-2-enyl diphosphate reductase [Burkholderiales bacterium]OQC57666.1 MAG: 4-hydroxy-3-methylbut-2-enyl diphosphate reductase [Bacteroidetes bacterium ADurb.Bin013]MBP8998755.1 4-hydroxy-3-methylbut-2-enyl diphosphate reductase [Bacteroidales bacterium]MBV6455336.1 4-hydroxy-3-methylbut-2-enyl diphosphate reductase [Bacteroidales bacterium]